MIAWEGETVGNSTIRIYNNNYTWTVFADLKLVINFDNVLSIYAIITKYDTCHNNTIKR